MTQPPTRIRGDFNGWFPDAGILCISHGDTAHGENGRDVPLTEGMHVVAFEEDELDGVRDDLIATGAIERAPEWLQSHGSRWVLRVDANGVRHESEMGPTP